MQILAYSRLLGIIIQKILFSFNFYNIYQSFPMSPDRININNLKSAQNVLHGEIEFTKFWQKLKKEEDNFPSFWIFNSFIMILGYWALVV